MMIRRHRFANILFLCCALAFLAVFLSARTFAVDAPAAVSGSHGKPAEPQTASDTLGRDTPHGTVIGFIQMAERGQFKLAANYLEGRESAKKKEELARNLEVVLNRGLKVNLEGLSKSPDGRLDDDLPVDLEKVGTATYGSESLDIVLRRTTKPGVPPIWLFSSETLLGVTAAAEQLDLAWGEAIWPESFRSIRILSYPLFLWINLLVSVPLLCGIAWLVTGWLLVVLRPVFLRQSEEYGESALAGTKWLLFLLVFSIVARILSTAASTVGGRQFTASLSTVLIIVAVSGLLIRITKLVTRLKIIHLRQGRSRSKIATVELGSWLLVCLWAIAGMFLILRSFDFELTAAVAGLGVGGIAIAFAAQKTIENLFGTVMVIADEVIHVGDYCQAGSIEGRVESIGLRSTRIRTLDRNLVSIPNGQLSTMSIGNLARRDKFLFRHNIRLRYETTANQLRDVMAKIRKVMSEQAGLESGTA